MQHAKIRTFDPVCYAHFIATDVAKMEKHQHLAVQCRGKIGFAYSRFVFAPSGRMRPLTQDEIKMAQPNRPSR